MSLLDKELEYYNYIIDHKKNVINMFRLFYCKYSNENYDWEKIRQNIYMHDLSNFFVEEFEGYRQYFYPLNEQKKNREIMEKSWKHHIDNNPHHWEFWKLKGKPIPMPMEYIIEMLCDWGAQKLKFGEIIEDWFNEQKNILFHDRTREIILNLIPKFDKILKVGNI